MEESRTFSISASLSGSRSTADSVSMKPAMARSISVSI
jgi:hypothetical protein